MLCSQCHVKQARDWAFGAHGKRVGSWQGERQVYNCTVCHYQHHPAIEATRADGRARGPPGTGAPGALGAQGAAAGSVLRRRSRYGSVTSPTLARRRSHERSARRQARHPDRLPRSGGSGAAPLSARAGCGRRRRHGQRSGLGRQHPVATPSRISSRPTTSG